MRSIPQIPAILLLVVGMMSPAGGAVRQPRADAQGHCANRVDVAKLCPLVANQTTHRDDVLGTRYAYQQEIYQASCIVPADSPDARREKIREFWRRSGASLTCTQLDFTVKDGHLLKLAVQKNAQDFVEEAVLDWKVDLNQVDASDHRTVLDFVAAEQVRSAGTNRARIYKKYFDLLRENGAKFSREL